MSKVSTLALITQKYSSKLEHIHSNPPNIQRITSEYSTTHRKHKKFKYLN